ncbi:hypothetical protein GLOIN_2v1768910 [Rhizophagus irregularis DAOM 181602=DAOM 197198]|nr:hypothetical protein GLOIN_2v1768910 [Rhizophagus irregularis DAOM 181602=DAOM 197198]
MPATKRPGQVIPVRDSKWQSTRVVQLLHEYILRPRKRSRMCFLFLRNFIGEQTLTSWVINVRIPLQELWAKKKKLSVYHRNCLFARLGKARWLILLITNPEFIRVVWPFALLLEINKNQ